MNRLPLSGNEAPASRGRGIARRAGRDLRRCRRCTRVSSTRCHCWSISAAARSCWRVAQAPDGRRAEASGGRDPPCVFLQARCGKTGAGQTLRLWRGAYTRRSRREILYGPARCPHHRGAAQFRNGSLPYLYMSLMIEDRAIWAYRIYQQVLAKQKCGISLKPVFWRRRSCISRPCWSKLKRWTAHARTSHCCVLRA